MSVRKENAMKKKLAQTETTKPSALRSIIRPHTNKRLEHLKGEHLKPENNVFPSISQISQYTWAFFQLRFDFVLFSPDSFVELGVWRLEGRGLDYEFNLCKMLPETNRQVSTLLGFRQRSIRPTNAQWIEYLFLSFSFLHKTFSFLWCSTFIKSNSKTVW